MVKIESELLSRRHPNQQHAKSSTLSPAWGGKLNEIFGQMFNKSNAPAKHPKIDQGYNKPVRVQQLQDVTMSLQRS